MSQDIIYQGSNITFDGGLDLKTPPLTANPGSLDICHNYEVIDRVGYKVIDGYWRFDGAVDAGQIFNNFRSVVITTRGVGSGPTKEVPEGLLAVPVYVWLYKYGPRRPFFVIVGYSNPIVHPDFSAGDFYIAQGFVLDKALFDEWLDTGKAYYLPCEGIYAGDKEEVIAEGGPIYCKPQVAPYYGLPLWSHTPNGVLFKDSEVFAEPIHQTLAGFIPAIEDYTYDDEVTYGVDYRTSGLYASLSNIAKSYDRATRPTASGQKVYGLFDIRDNIYGVTDCYRIFFHNGKYIPQVGDLIEGAIADEGIPDPNYFIVLGVDIVSGDTASENAAGTIHAMYYPQRSGTFYYDWDSSKVRGINVHTVSLWSIKLAKSGNIISNAFDTIKTVPEDPDFYSNIAADIREYSTESSVPLPKYGLIANAGDIHNTSVDGGDNSGWMPIHTGWNVKYKDGHNDSNGNPPKKVSKAFSPTEQQVTVPTPAAVPGQVDFPSYTFEFAGDTITVNSTWEPVGDSDPVVCLASADSTKYLKNSNRDTDSTHQPGLTGFVASDFDLSNLADGAVVQGIKITARVKVDPDSTPPPVDDTNTLRFEITNSDQTVIKTVNVDGVTSWTDITLGGEGDTLDLSDISTDAIKSGFSIKVIEKAQYGDDAKFHYVSIDTLNIVIYYVATSSHYFIWTPSAGLSGTGAFTGTCDIINYTVDDGSFGDGDASGELQVANITRLDNLYGYDGALRAGDELYEAPSSLSQRIASITNDMEFNGLPSSSDLDKAKARIETHKHNFFGDPVREATYIATGAGRALSFDGLYLKKIYSQFPSGDDIPRHVSSFQNHLVLGYKTGAVSLSVTGQPENFDGIFGAETLFYGHPITGFRVLAGTTLGIFANEGIYSLTGTSSDSYQSAVLSSNEGAIEYTLAGENDPIYCTPNGISTLSQTASYGDFLGNRLSDDITSWLVPRIRGDNSSILFSTTVRQKNQYRIYFKGGEVLTMSMTQKGPQFTTQSYDLTDNVVGYGYPAKLEFSCVHSFVDSRGRENIFAAPNLKPDKLSYVYKLDSGWGFRGMEFPHYLRTSYTYLGDMADFDTVKKVRLNISGKGYQEFYLCVKPEYNSDDQIVKIPGNNPFELANPSTIRKMKFPSDSHISLYDDNRNPLDIKYINLSSSTATGVRSKSISITVGNNYTYADDLEFDSNSPGPFAYPPEIVQSAQLQFMPTKGDT